MIKMISLGDRMKTYEKCENIPFDNHIVIRVDGNNFSKFTRNFMGKPFDVKFTQAMVSTMNDMMSKFHFTTAYCCSDEITFVIRATSVESGHEFNGRVHKLNSLVSGKCSVLFLKNILKYVDDNVLKSAIMECAPCFDSRIMVFDDNIKYEITNNIYWRSCHDCYRNCISSVGRFILGSKAIFKKSSPEVVKILKDKKGFDEENIPICLRYGVYSKKFTVCKVNDDGEQYERTIVKNFTFKINPSMDGITDYILQKKDSGDEYKKFGAELFDVTTASYSFDNI